MDIYCYYNQLQRHNGVYPVTLCPFGFMNNILSGTKYRVSPAGESLMDETNNLASPTENHRWERSPLIHSYGYDYDGHPALALRARFAHANLLPANLSAGDRSSWLLVSSMRLTPIGACAKNLSRRFFTSLPLKSKSFMQYTG